MTPAPSEKVKNAKLRAARYFALRGGESSKVTQGSPAGVAILVAIGGLLLAEISS